MGAASRWRKNGGEKREKNALTAGEQSQGENEKIRNSIIGQKRRNVKS